MDIGESAKYTYLGKRLETHIFYDALTDSRIEVDDDQLYGQTLLKEKVDCTLQRARLNCYIVGVGGL